MKYGMLAQPAAMFRRMHARFAVDDALTVLIAEANGVPIAGVILLQCADILYYKFNASSEQHLRPNDILIWNAILYGHRNGMKLLDFGLSAGDHPGLIRYKRKFATDERNIQFFEWCPDECVDIRAEQTSEVLDRVTRLLTHPTVPDEITRAAGEQLYRFFA
jgi:CelD/BcsL family acetyltransferase involved in cellulose biosynthesis